MTSRQRRVLIAVTISSSVTFLDGSVVNLALPALARDLHAGLTAQQWVVDGYLLSLSALILLGGSLGDLFGRKRIYLIGLLGFGTTSLLCALMPVAPALITARLLQGVFGALLVPGALAIIETNFEASERGRAFGLWTAWSSAATAGGPLLGGYLIDISSWRWIFLINLPLVLLAAILAIPSVKETRQPGRRQLDFTGAALAMLSLAGLTYGLIQGPAAHWAALTLAALALGVLLAVGFIYAESRSTNPMLPLQLFRSANFTATNLVTFSMYGALGGFFFALVIYLQSILHYTSLQAGLAGLPVTLLLLGLSSRAGAWSGRLGPRLFLTLGPIISGLGIAWLWPLHAGSSYWLGVLPGVVLFGLGMALLVAPLTTTVMASVGPAHSGIASAINNAVARVSGLICVALLDLLGAAHMYQFAVALCAVLAIAAGLIAWLQVRNPTVTARPSARHHTAAA